MEKKKIVFLYTELATYFLACIEELLKQPSVEVHIIRWKVNAEAPFKFNFSSEISIYDRNNYDKIQLSELISNISPSVIYSSGWTDKGYLHICKKYRNSIPVIIGFDNQWKGSFKQYVACLISPFRILNHFTHCWVPGELQKIYALKLGFKEGRILTGFYCCDYNYFYEQYMINRINKQRLFPKRFIYVGRYVEHKGIKDLWKAFIEITNELPSKWELWCLGTGDVEPVEHPAIKHFGFVQPEELKSFIAETGVFVLPSHFEPWGVVVHEFAAAGFPLICSDAVGASGTFVENNLNGYIYRTGNHEALKEALLKVIRTDDQGLFMMGEESSQKAGLITPEIWVKKIMSLL